MKGQIEIVSGIVMLMLAMLMIFLSAEAVSEESVTREAVVQTQLSVTEFKTLAAMNALLQSEDPSITKQVRNPDDDIEEEMQRIEQIFAASNAESDDREYYVSVEGTDIAYGSEPLVEKSIYLASPDGPKLMEVGATR